MILRCRGSQTARKYSTHEGVIAAWPSSCTLVRQPHRLSWLQPSSATDFSIQASTTYGKWRRLLLYALYTVDTALPPLCSLPRWCSTTVVIHRKPLRKGVVSSRATFTPDPTSQCLVLKPSSENVPFLPTPRLYCWISCRLHRLRSSVGSRWHPAGYHGIPRNHPVRVSVGRRGLPWHAIGSRGGMYPTESLGTSHGTPWYPTGSREVPGEISRVPLILRGILAMWLSTGCSIGLSTTHPMVLHGASHDIPQPSAIFLANLFPRAFPERS